MVSVWDRVRSWLHWRTVAIVLLPLAALAVVFLGSDVPEWAGLATAFALLSAVWAIDSLGDSGLHDLLHVFLSESAEETYVRLGRSVAPTLAAVLAIVAIVGGIAGTS